MEIHRLAAVVKRWLPLMLVGMVVLAVPAYLWANSRNAQYEASTRLLVSTPPDARQDALLVAAQRASLYNLVAGTREFATVVIEDLGLDTSPEGLLRQLSSTSGAGDPVVTLKVTADDPAEAARIANRAAELLKAQSVSDLAEQAPSEIGDYLATVSADIQRVQARISAIEAITLPTAADLAELGALRERLVPLFDDYERLLALWTTYNANRLVTLEAAVPPEDPAGSGTIFYVLLAATAGLIAASAVAFLLASRDDTMRSAQEIRDEAADLREVGAIDEKTGDIKRGGAFRVVTLTAPRSPSADAYRALRTQLSTVGATRPMRSLAVTSLFDEKTAISANLAVTFALAGFRVLLIDADLREPSLHTFFDLPNGLGLSGALTMNRVSLHEIMQPSRVPGLSILPTGSRVGSALDLVASPRMRDVLAAAAGDQSIVIVEAPPLLRAPESAALASNADATVLVVDRNRTRRSALADASDLLAAVRATPVGMVMYGHVRGTTPPAGAEPEAPGPWERGATSSNSLERQGTS